MDNNGNTPQTAAAEAAEALKQAANTQPEGGQTTGQTPEAIPYARFQEVNTEKKTLAEQNQQLQSELAQTQNYLMQMLQGQEQQQPEAQQQQQPLSREEYWHKADQDPLAWEQDIRKNAVNEALEIFRSEQAKQQSLNAALGFISDKYSNFGNEAHQVILQTAMQLDSHLPRNYTQEQVIDIAAQQVFKGFGINLNEDATAAKNAVEGNGNMVPEKSADELADERNKAYQAKNPAAIAHLAVQSMFQKEKQ